MALSFPSIAALYLSVNAFSCSGVAATTPNATVSTSVPATVKIFVEVFVSGGLLVYRGQFRLISPVGLVKSIPQTRIKSGGSPRALGAGRNLFLTFFVSEASVLVEGRRS